MAISDILTDIDAATFSAKYKPVPLENMPVEGCVLPEWSSSVLSLTPITMSPEALALTCDTSFNPQAVAIAIPPFPPTLIGDILSGIVMPCDTFSFEAQVNSTDLPAGAAVTQNLVSGEYRITSTNFALSAIVGTYDAATPLPTLELKTAITPSGSDYTVVNGQEYTVAVSDPTTYVTYNSVKYYNGESFLCITANGTTAVASDITGLVLNETERRRVTKRGTADSYFVLDQSFNSVPSGATNFQFNRVSVGSNINRLTGGQFGYIPDPVGENGSSCGGKFIGDINININDLDSPCPTGVNFDAGYTNHDGDGYGDAIEGAVETGIVSVSNGASALNFEILIPHDGYDILPTLKITIGGVTSYHQVVSVTDAHHIVVDPPVYFISTHAWSLERINVQVSSDDTSSTFRYNSLDACGGIFTGLININDAAIGLNIDDLVPCNASLNAKSLVELGTYKTFTITDNNQATPLTSTAYLYVDNAAACSYKIGMGATGTSPSAIPEFNIPKIQIALRKYETSPDEYAAINTAFQNNETYTPTVDRTISSDKKTVTLLIPYSTSTLPRWM